MKHLNMFEVKSGTLFLSKLSALLLAFLLLVSPLMPVWAEEIEDSNTQAPTPIADTNAVDAVVLTDPAPTEPITEEIPVPENNDLAIEPTEDKQTEPDLTQPFNPENLTAGLTEDKKGLLETDEITGALNYSFPVVVPNGRNGLQPSIKLNYNNQQANNYPNLIGYGWNIDIPYIDRINRTGTDKLYTSNYFYSSLSGELVLVSGTTYAPKVENGDFLKYTYDGTFWTVKDKTGTTYKFGQNALSRQDDTTGAKVAKWMLEETKDTNSNFIKYEYYKHGGQIYPSKIKYTGNGTTDGIFEVEFLRESRVDITKSYSAAFLVTTNYRISEIQTKINNVWVKKYTMAYTTGDAGVRSLLASITESGQDENSVVTILPATSFDYYKSTPGWTLNTTTYAAPTAFGDGFQSMLDINGDALPDIIESYTGAQLKKNTYLNNTHNSWTLNSSLQPTILFRENEIRGGSANSAWDQGVRVGDVNGDLLPDIIKSEEDTVGEGGYDAYLNTNGSSWMQNNTWYPTSVTFNGDDNVSSWGSHLVDLNADGLPDVIRKQGNSSGTQLNTGIGFSASTQNWIPVMEYLQGPFSQLVDINNDNLPDIIHEIWINSGTTHTKEIYINKGDGTWVLDNSFLIPIDIIYQSNSDAGVRFFDVNNDGLIDVFTQYGSLGSGGRGTYLNTGTGGWISTPAWNSPEGVDFSSDPTNIADLNADGSLDFLMTQNSIPIVTNALVNKTTTPTDTLKKITFPQGGNTTINYKKSSKYYDSSNNLLNPNFPIPLDTVYQLVTVDGNNNTSTDSFSYEGGLYYFNTFTDRRPAGFAKVTNINSVGTKTTNYYHQGNSTSSSQGEYDDHQSKIGRIYRTEIADSSGNIYESVINKWEKQNLGTGRDFVKLAQTLTMSLDGNSDYRSKAEEYSYDSYGNVIQKISWGEVTGATDGTFIDLGSDKFTENISYASNVGNYVVGLPSQDTVLDQNSNKVREAKMYYDELALGSVVAGNNTKTENWKTGTTYVNTQKVYNTTYGLITSSINELGKTTDYVYDSSNLYPATVTDPLSHTTLYTYDYSAGKPKQITDQNGFIYQTVFDGLDRVLQEKIPDFTVPYLPVLKTQYVYTDTSGAVKIQKTDYLDATNSMDTYQYFDGLNRLIQERREAEQSNSYNTRDVVYNNFGLIQKESLPYSSNGSAVTSATTDTSLYTSYSYDPLKRITNIANAVGSTITSYDNWKTSITDPNNKLKHFSNDAYGNLVKVEEINGANIYTTNYEWNGNKKLTKITDALNNVRNFTYDGLGRRLTAEDLHASADTTYGSWMYVYDNAGNMTQSTNPKAEIVDYEYDSLNRVRTENFAGETGVELTYTYDSCTNGVGKLCTATNLDGTSSVYTYDALGNIASDKEIVNDSVFDTSYTYDRQGNNLIITTPDSAQIKNTFNTAGLLEKIESKESTGTFANVISNFDYSPMGQVLIQAYANTVTTTNTYDSTKLYRLTRKLTQNTFAVKMQDLNYTYDNVGNITKIVDASNTDTAKTADYVYDDLYRLTSATITGVATGQTPYTQTYTYDAVGNILTGPMGTYLYEGNLGANYTNPHAVTSIDGAPYTYDADGNLLSSGNLIHTWNYKDQLTRSAIVRTAMDNYYDYQGNRVRYKAGFNDTYYPNKFYNLSYVYSPLRIRGVIPPKIKKTKQIYAGDQLVATIETEKVIITPYYVHSDHLGSTTAVSNSAGVSVQTLDYYPYGNQRLSSGDYNEQRQYIGQIYDVETGLDYLNARYYDGNRGQFISQDPIFLLTGSQDFSKKWDTNWRHSDKNQFKDQSLIEYLSNPQNLNSYSYGLNNPITMSDPTGLFAVKLGFTTNIGLGGEVGNSWEIGFASDGTFGISTSLHGGGLAGADASIGISGGYSNAKTWSDTLGTDNYVSVGGKILLGGGVTTNFSEGKYSGTDVGVGIGARLGPTPIPITFSGGVTKTTPVFQGSVSGIINSVKNTASSVSNIVSQSVKSLINKLTN